MSTAEEPDPPHVRIGSRSIGPGRPTYVIAEISANHGQEYGRALDLVRIAKEVGADAVKLQTYTADTITIDSDAPPFRVRAGTIWEGRNLHDLYDEAHTPWEWQPRLKAEADSLGLDLFSTPFDASSVAFLERELDPPAYKIASFELIDHGLVELVASTGKPVILSTGMATSAEIDAAVDVVRRVGSGGLVLLRCNSGYPADPSEMDLRTIPDMASRWRVPIGLSDHTLGIAASVAAVALGACVIEKHITLARGDGGPDSSFSLEPPEFAALIEGVRTAEQALGAVRYGPAGAEVASLAFRRSLFVVEEVAAGETLSERTVRSIRPGDGLPPSELSAVLGRRAKRRIARGTPLSWDLVE